MQGFSVLEKNVRLKKNLTVYYLSLILIIEKQVKDVVV